MSSLPNDNLNHVTAVCKLASAGEDIRNTGPAQAVRTYVDVGNELLFYA